MTTYDPFHPKMGLWNSLNCPLILPMSSATLKLSATVQILFWTLLATEPKEGGLLA